MILITALLLYPRLRRTLKYTDFVSKPGTAARLAVIPAKIQVVVANGSAPISTRWATFSVPADLLNSMTAHETWLNLESQTDTSVLLTELHYETQFTADGNFSFQDAAANATPTNALDVFLMSNSAFEDHMKLIVAKFANGFRDRGVSRFQTEYTKGMIYHGGAGSPSDIEIHLWHLSAPVSEIIVVSSPDHAVRESIARSIAASFRFTIDAVPDRDALLQLAKESAEAFNAAG